MLNELLSLEYAQYIEMATQASITSGTEALYMKKFFEEQAEGALRHASLLRERIFFLGGTPLTKPAEATIYKTTQEALSAGINDHKRFIELYRNALTSIKKSDGNILYETIEEILEDEQKDLEAFVRLSGELDSYSAIV